MVLPAVTFVKRRVSDATTRLGSQTGLGGLEQGGEE
jgi:hypothetical protein